MSHFVWSFKIGDNIVFNLRVLNKLYKNRDNDSLKYSALYNKPISILIVSVIEAVMIDLIGRIDEARNDLPKIDEDVIRKIKSLIQKYKKKEKVKDDLSGEIVLGTRRKNYQMRDTIEIFKDFSLLEPLDDSIYSSLGAISRFRNRVHILNYFDNFETDESEVFTDKRVLMLEKILNDIILVMEEKYYRHGLSKTSMDSNYNVWLSTLDEI